MLGGRGKENGKALLELVVDGIGGGSARNGLEEASTDALRETVPPRRRLRLRDDRWWLDDEDVAEKSRSTLSGFERTLAFSMSRAMSLSAGVADDNESDMTRCWGRFFLSLPFRPISPIVLECGPVSVKRIGLRERSLTICGESDLSFLLELLLLLALFEGCELEGVKSEGNTRSNVAGVRRRTEFEPGLALDGEDEELVVELLSLELDLEDDEGRLGLRLRESHEEEGGGASDEDGEAAAAGGGIGSSRAPISSSRSSSAPASSASSSESMSMAQLLLAPLAAEVGRRRPANMGNTIASVIQNNVIFCKINMENPSKLLRDNGKTKNKIKPHVDEFQTGCHSQESVFRPL